jgi:DNA-binding NtrC family response regulator
VGGAQAIDVDVRVICATNRNLAGDVREKRFREDLFFRINVFPVTIPPLRARKEDIGALASFFLQKFAREMNKRSLRLSDEAGNALHAYDWPGNIRELQNALERAAILCDAETITPRDLGIATDAQPAALDLSGTLADAVRSAEKLKIADTLRRAASRNEAAEMLGIAVRTLATKIKELGLGDEGSAEC